jgi:hypothetical protein
MKTLIISSLAAVLLASPAGAAPSKTDSVFPRGLPYAISEDGCAAVKRCVWDGRHQGNGEGRSYILTRFHGEYLVAYIAHRRAHRLQALWCQRPSVNCGYAD